MPHLKSCPSAAHLYDLLQKLNLKKNAATGAEWIKMKNLLETTRLPQWRRPTCQKLISCVNITSTELHSPAEKKKKKAAVRQELRSQLQAQRLIGSTAWADDENVQGLHEVTRKMVAKIFRLPQINA